jgi:TonB family protein
MTLCSQVLLAGCVTTVLATAGAQQATNPTVVLSRIEGTYPPIARSARVRGTVNVRVGVRPDGTVSETTVLRDVPLLSEAAVKAASGAMFECRQCTEPATPHTISFVFSLLDTQNSPPRPVWKQTGTASTEVTIFGNTPLCDHCERALYRVRAARCLWLWRCSETY